MGFIGVNVDNERHGNYNIFNFINEHFVVFFVPLQLLLLLFWCLLLCNVHYRQLYCSEVTCCYVYIELWRNTAQVRYQVLANFILINNLFTLTVQLSTNPIFDINFCEEMKYFDLIKLMYLSWNNPHYKYNLLNLTLLFTTWPTVMKLTTFIFFSLLIFYYWTVVYLEVFIVQVC